MDVTMRDDGTTWVVGGGGGSDGASLRRAAGDLALVVSVLMARLGVECVTVEYDDIVAARLRGPLDVAYTRNDLDETHALIVSRAHG